VDRDPITFEYEDVWAPDSAYLFCRRRKSVAFAKEMNIVKVRPIFL